MSKITLIPSATTVAQGGSITVQANGADAAGNPVVVDQSEMAYSSSVATDVINGNRITFPTASPHVITARHVPTGVTASVTVQVTPAAVTPRGPGTLPKTGSEITPDPWVAGALMLAGASALDD